MVDKLEKIASTHIQNQKNGLYPCQKSKEWDIARSNMITASVCATILDSNIYESSRELFLQKISDASNIVENRSKSNMDWGNKYEPIARTIYERIMSTSVYEIGLVTHPLYNWLGASPDGIMSSGKLLEIKCPINRKIGEVPYYYWIQVQIQMEVCDLDSCDFMDCKFEECSLEHYNLIDEKIILKGIIQQKSESNSTVQTQYYLVKNYVIHNIKRDKKWFQDNINYLKIFWDKVILYREKGQRQLNENTHLFEHHGPINFSEVVSVPPQRGSKRVSNLLQEDPNNILPDANQILRSNHPKRSCISDQTDELIDWNNWVSATKTRNYIIQDPLIDWLEYHGNKHTKFESERKVESSRHTENPRANYDIGDRFDSDFNNNIIFTNLLKNNGIKFEQYVMKELFAKFPDNILTIANQYQARSIIKSIETINAMNEGIPIIYQGVLHNKVNQSYGMPDLIVRSDWINKIFNNPVISKTREGDKARNLRIPKGESWHYRIVDIKFITLNMRVDGKHMLKTSSIEAIKAQLYVYNMALREIQGYNPAKSYIIGCRWMYKKNSITMSGNGWSDRAGHINFKSDDKHIRAETINAIEWIRNVRQHGHKFTVNPPSCPEMYPNMCNGLDGPWRRVKNKIAKDIFEITSLWQCGVKNRKASHAKGVFGWNDPRCISETLGVGGALTKSTLQQILDSNQNPKIKILGREKHKETTLNTNGNIIPPKIQSNDLRLWHGLKNIYKKNTLFVDFETTQNILLDTDLTGSSNIFMIGIVYCDSSTREYLYKCFYANNLTEQEELRIFSEFHDFVWKFSNKKKGKLVLPDLIHWSHAEKTFYNTCWSKYGNKIIESGYTKIDTWKDMLKVFKDEPITIRGALNFSLKSIAKAFYTHGFIKTTWEDTECADGMTAMVLAHQCYDSVSKGEIRLGSSNDIMSIPTMREIRSYNEVDCRVLQEILSYLVQNH